jgi:hypothetical protein
VGLDEEPGTPNESSHAVDYGRGGLDVPQAGGVLDRRGVLVLGCSFQLLLLRLDVSDVGPVERVAVQARTTPPTGSLRADVPGSRTHPAPPLVASCRRSVCSRCCSQLSRAPRTGGRAPVSGAFAAAALLATAYPRSTRPCLGVTDVPIGGRNTAPDLPLGVPAFCAVALAGEMRSVRAFGVLLVPPTWRFGPPPPTLEVRADGPRLTSIWFRVTC